MTEIFHAKCLLTFILTRGYLNNHFPFGNNEFILLKITGQNESQSGVVAKWLKKAWNYFIKSSKN